MSEPKFTPGPWHAKRYVGAALEEYYEISTSDGLRIAISPTEADSQLIAAAPDMYELLSQILEYEPKGVSLNFFDRMNPKIEKILRKARGESEVRDDY